MERYYDYIIAGGGCAGLQLALGLATDASLAPCRILIVDRAPKAGNDRTWCFWSQHPGPYSGLLCKTWDQLSVSAPGFDRTESIAPYTYGMLRSADFYAYAYAVLADHPQVQFHYGEIGHIREEAGRGVVWVDGVRFEARYVFNSCLGREQLQPREGYAPFWQHFKGWWIRAEAAIFDPGRATLMDFRVAQAGGLSFMYVLPLSASEALVEYTVFSSDLLPDMQYDEALSKYMDSLLSGSGYAILETEKGVIPMFPLPEAHPTAGAVVPIGSLGGAVKPTTGYAFMRIQSDTRDILDCLRRGRPPVRKQATSRFTWYDRLLLHLLQQHTSRGVAIFSSLFRRNPYRLILRFLDEQTLPTQEVRIFSGLPVGLFSRAALELWAKRFIQRWPLSKGGQPAANPYSP